MGLRPSHKLLCEVSTGEMAPIHSSWISFLFPFPPSLAMVASPSVSTFAAPFYPMFLTPLLYSFLTAIGRVCMPACSALPRLCLPMCTCVLTGRSAEMHPVSSLTLSSFSPPPLSSVSHQKTNRLLMCNPQPGISSGTQETQKALPILPSHPPPPKWHKAPGTVKRKAFSSHVKF